MNSNYVIKHSWLRTLHLTIFIFLALTQTILAITFFGEDFNSVWSTTNPPSGWRIAFTGDTSAIVGAVFLRGSTWRKDWPSSNDPILVYELSLNRQATWVKVQYHYEYGDPVTFQWTQKGQHHWGNPNNMEHSQASAIW
jgi:hypothetical protein